jgi:glycine oxidase
MNPNIVIIGAGVIGLSTACSLARRGARVTVLERGSVGGESSWAGAGILSALPPWGYNSRVTRIIEDGRRQWPIWADAIRQCTHVDPEYRLTGMLALDVADPLLARTWCEANNWPCAVGAEALSRGWPERPLLRPEIHGDADRHVWLPTVAQVRNPRLVRGMALLAEGLGVKIVTSQAVLALRATGNRVTHVCTDSTEHECTHVVVCAGAWSAQVLAGMEGNSAPPPIKPIRGQMLLFRDAPGRLPCILYSQSKYLVPRADGHILAGSTLEDVGYDKSITQEALSELRRFAWEAVPWLHGIEPLMQWSGLRPGTQDNIPVIGRHPDMENVFVNSGHFRYGVTMAPAAAERLADILWNGSAEQPLVGNCLDTGDATGYTIS